MNNEALQSAMVIWKAFRAKRCALPDTDEWNSAMALADAFLMEHHPGLRDRMACNRCDLLTTCEFALDPYNLDCVAKVDCLATK